MKRVDLNCDLGESFGSYTCGMDSQVIPHISSANVACGFHAGDPLVMKKTAVSFIIIVFIMLVFSLLSNYINWLKQTDLQALFFAVFYVILPTICAAIMLLFKNKIVFINIIGNIILFIPMGIIMKSLNVRLIEFLILILFIIFLIELTQYISKRGVFDISDIILNYIGCILGYILIRKRGERYE